MAPFNNNEKLSESVKLYPCLYNKQEKDFKKEDIKQRAWNEIAKELNISNGKEAVVPAIDTSLWFPFLFLTSSTSSNSQS